MGVISTFDLIVKAIKINDSLKKLSSHENVRISYNIQ